MAPALHFRAPKRGDVVEVLGLRSRPELNGSVGEVVSAASDSDGRVTVRLGNVGGRGEVKIQLSRLRSAPTPLVAASSSAARSPTPAMPQRSHVPLLLPAATPSRASSTYDLAPSSIASSARALQHSAPRATSSLSAKADRSTSMPAPGVDLLQARYKADRAAWKRGYVPFLSAECGARYHKAVLATDVTAFDKEFLQCTSGVPIHKHFPSEGAVLRNPRSGNLEPPWAP